MLIKAALSEVQRQVFDSILEHQLTRDNTLGLIRPCDNEMYKKEKPKEEPWKLRSRNFGRVLYGPKQIDITIAKSSFTVYYNMIFDNW